MKIVFVDLMGITYDLDTPYTKPLGGTQSAVCFLLEELTIKKEHELYLFNRSASNGTIIRNVYMYDVNDMNKIKEIKPDIIIVCAFPDVALEMKKIYHCPLILWTQNDYDQFPIHKMLKERYIIDMIDCFMFVSEWHMYRMIKYYKIPTYKCCVLRNGIAKPFEKYLEMDIEKEKNSLIYASTPFRGLELHIQIFPEILKTYSDSHLYIYSSMNTYQSSDTEYEKMYDILKRMDNVKYSEGISQNELADVMGRMEILSYPNTFPETSCITVLQAMACGCIIITSDLGALYETTNGQNFLIHKSEGFLEKTYISEFIDTTKFVMKLSNEHKKIIIERNKKFIKENHLWKNLANIFLNICENVIKVPRVSLDNTFFMERNYEKAIKYYLDIKTYNSLEDLAIKYINVGVCMYHLGNKREGRKWIKYASKMASSYDIHKNLMYMYHESGKIQKALGQGYLVLKILKNTNGIDKNINELVQKILTDI